MWYKLRMEERIRIGFEESYPAFVGKSALQRKSNLVEEDKAVLLSESEEEEESEDELEENVYDDFDIDSNIIRYVYVDVTLFDQDQILIQIH